MGKRTFKFNSAGKLVEVGENPMLLEPWFFHPSLPQHLLDQMNEHNQRVQRITERWLMGDGKL